MNLQYGYGAGTANNGQISQVTEAISGEQVVYTYDSLKRLIKAETLQSGGTHWGQSFGYDGYGNLLTENPTAGHMGTTMPLTVDAATNRLTTSGFSHDANGNMTGMPAVPHNLTPAYDVENRTGGGYFDQQNQPLCRDGQWNLYGPRGERLGIYTYTVTVGTNWCMDYQYNYALADATQTSRNIYFGGRLIVSNGTTVVTDPAGSARTDANSNGALFGYYPYGENIGNSPGAGGERFATYTRESGTGLDYAVSRNYAAIYGRLNTPDRYTASAGAGDPGSWNRYAYVGGDPINYSDPTGSIKFLPGSDPTDFESQPCMEPGRNGINNYWEYVDNFPNVGCIVGGVAYFGGKPGRGGGDDNSHPPPPPGCSISLYERPVGVPIVGAFADHTYLYIQNSSGRETIEGGPDLVEVPLGYLIGTVSNPPGNGLRGTNPFGSGNRQVGTPYAASLACDLARRIERAESTYNTSGVWAKYDATAIGGYNSNSFTYSLLYIAGLSGFFGPNPGWTPGWGQLVPGLR
jgi:RHS repeat-associated protein